MPFSFANWVKNILKSVESERQLNKKLFCPTSFVDKWKRKKLQGLTIVDDLATIYELDKIGKSRTNEETHINDVEFTTEFSNCTNLVSSFHQKISSSTWTKNNLTMASLISPQKRPFVSAVVGALLITLGLGAFFGMPSLVKRIITQVSENYHLPHSWKMKILRQNDELFFILINF